MKGKTFSRRRANILDIILKSTFRRLIGWYEGHSSAGFPFLSMRLEDLEDTGWLPSRVEHLFQILIWVLISWKKCTLSCYRPSTTLKSLRRQNVLGSSLSACRATLQNWPHSLNLLLLLRLLPQINTQHRMPWFGKVSNWSPRMWFILLTAKCVRNCMLDKHNISCWTGLNNIFITLI